MERKFATGGGEGSRSILEGRREKWQGKVAILPISLSRFHFDATLPPNIVSIVNVSLHQAKTDKGKRIFLAIPKFPPPTLLANALCYGNTRVRRVSTPLYRPRRMLVQELLKNPDPDFDKGISLSLEKRRQPWKNRGRGERETLFQREIDIIIQRKRCGNIEIQFLESLG